MRRFTLGLTLATILTPGCELATSFDGYSARRDALDASMGDGAIGDAARETGTDAGHDASVDVGVVPDALVMHDAGTDAPMFLDTGSDGCVVDAVATCAGRCGSVTDPVCGFPVNCGNPCVLPQTCGGGAGPTFCGCVANAISTTCSGHCGVIDDNCGTPVDCGNPCTGHDTCGGGGIPHACGCTVTGNACAGTACGDATNNCGGVVHCDTCFGSTPVCHPECDRCLSSTASCP
jgi:hypothetical protein